MLETVRRVAQPDAAGRGGAVDRAAALLDDVGQLVREGDAASVGGRVIAVALEHDVGADGVGVGVHRPGRLLGAGVVVDPDVAEVVAQPGLHVGPHAGVERLPAAGVDHVVHRGRFLVLKGGRHALIAGRSLQVEYAVGADHVPAACRGRLVERWPGRAVEAG